MSEKLETFLVESKEDYDSCIDVLDQVRRAELNRAGKSVLESDAIGSVKTNYKLFACRLIPSGKIIGSIKLTPAEDIASIEASRIEYRLDAFPDTLLPHLVISTRLVVLPEYRNSMAAFSLMTHTFKYHLENGGSGMLGTCEPGLYPMYIKMGLRPYGHPTNNAKRGYRFPMIGFIDHSYMRSISSPAYLILRKLDDSKFYHIQKWYASLDKNGFCTDNLNIKLYEPNNEDLHLYENLITDLSQAGVKTLLKNAVHITCKKGETVITEKDGGKFMGIVYSGVLNVRSGGKTVATLKQGELFGEIALVLNNYRTASLTAASDGTKLIILSKSSLKFSQLEDDKTMWRNIAKVLAAKLLAMNVPD